MGYTVKSGEFEGPLELLLDLIEKRKLFVNDVSLSQVADDYISHINTFEAFPVADSAQFILIASTLLLIKSKSLLPTLNLTLEEEANIYDLERRLKIYEKMREVSEKIKPLFGKNVLYARGERKVEPVFSPDEDMTRENMLSAIGRVLLSLPKKEFLPKVIVDTVISLEDMITDLTSRVNDSLRMSFRDFSASSASKGEKAAARVNIIVSFLAMLELVKQGIISVTQDKHFEDIQMETEQVGTPRY